MPVVPRRYRPDMSDSVGRGGLRRSLDDLVGVVFPGRCPGCGRSAEPVCEACATGLRAPPHHGPPPGIEAWVAPFEYSGVARELVARAKYHRRSATLRWLAGCMLEAWSEAIRGGVVPPRVDLVTWAPTASNRRRSRGFDHARVLARHVARGIGRPARGVLRRAPGPPQTSRSASERRGGPTVTAVRRVQGTVLLVDDVATTGATLRVCAAALREAGAVRVVAVTAARTARRRLRAPVSGGPTANVRRARAPRRRDGPRSERGAVRGPRTPFAAAGPGTPAAPAAGRERGPP